MVYCPRDEKEVPVWHCVGSYIQRRERCPEVIEATIKISDGYASVKCRAIGEEEKRRAEAK